MKKLMKLMILLATVLLTESSTYSMHKEVAKAQHKTAAEPKQPYQSRTPEQVLRQRRLNRGQFVSSSHAVKNQFEGRATLTVAIPNESLHPAVQRNITPDISFGVLDRQQAHQGERPHAPAPGYAINSDWVKSDKTAPQTIDMVLDQCIDLNTLDSLLQLAVQTVSPENVKILLRMGANPVFNNPKYDAAKTAVLNKVFPHIHGIIPRLINLDFLFNKKRFLPNDNKKIVTETQKQFEKCTKEEQGLLKIIDSLECYKLQRTSAK